MTNLNDHRPLSKEEEKSLLEAYGKNNLGRPSKKRIFYSAVLMVVVFAMTVSSLLAIHKYTENKCWDDLRSAADAADVQMISLVDNTYAYLNNMDDVLFNLTRLDDEAAAYLVSRCRIGQMQSELRLYLPDGRVFTASGVLKDASDKVNYDSIMASLNSDGRYISCVKTDYMDPTLQVLEFYAPVKYKGETVALASAVIDLKKLPQYIISTTYGGRSFIYCTDIRDDMIFVDTDNCRVYNGSELYSHKDKNGKSLIPFFEGNRNRLEAYTTVVSERYNMIGYMYSIPSKAYENWTVTITVSESEAFGSDIFVRRSLLWLASAEIFLYVLFLVSLSISIRRETALLVNTARGAKAKAAEALELAQSASRAKTTFLNNMSHDMRTPMNAIIGFTELAEKHIDNTLQVKGYLQKIKQASDHLLSLINDVLDMSRIESGNMSIDEKPENLKAIITNLRDIVQSDADSHSLSFSVDINVDNEDIFCDKLRLNQVLLNILSNSIKYTEPGGAVSMRVTEKSVNLNDSVTYEFVIEDNGIGMDEEFLKTIFDTFTRERSSTVSGIQGTGLGMAITKSIIDRMGGNIRISSKPKHGTKVTIDFEFRLQHRPVFPSNVTLFPVNATVHAHDTDDSAPAPLDFTGKKVLIVEDNEINCEIVTELLSEYGFEVSTAENGSIAVEMIKAAHKGDYDIVLMDIQMPVMDGYEATRRIRALGSDLSDIPILAMTANAFEEDRRQAFASGMNEHIAKPLDIDKLMKALARFLL